MRCSYCGSEVMDGANFCTECGAPLGQPFENTGDNAWDFDKTAEQSGWETAQDAWSQQSYGDQQQGYYGQQQNYGGQQQGYYGGNDPNRNAPYGNGYQQQQGWNQGANNQQNYGDKSKIVAGLLAILIGALGIHKFYLGYTKTGIIMLLVSVLSLGLAAWVMGIIGLVEGIIYLTKDDYDFYMTYVANEKKWF